jgi:hypothetical protein
MRCGDGDGFDWSAVVPRIANPTKIAIIELLCRERRPLSATKMLGLLDDPGLTVGRLDYHCKTLDRARVIRISCTRSQGVANEVFYELGLEG